MTNSEIVDSFLEHQSATGPVSTNGKEIKSFGETVAVWEDECIVMPNITGDKATIRCRNLVRQRALNKNIKVVMKGKVT